MKKQVLKVLFLCSFLASASLQAPFDFSGDDGVDYSSKVEIPEEIAAKKQREQEAVTQKNREQYETIAREAAAKAREAAVQTAIKKGAPAFDFSDEGDDDEGVQPNEPTTQRGHMEKTINDAWFEFDQAKGEAKLFKAKNVLGLSGDPSEATINAAYEAKLKAFKTLENNPSVIDIIDTRLKSARKFLLSEKTLSSFDVVSASDFEPVAKPQAPKSKLNTAIKLDLAFTEKLTDEDINNINTRYAKLKPERQEIFVKNIDRFAKDSEKSRPDMSDIISSAYADAEKSYSKSTWNRLVRSFKKLTSSEDAYFDTVLKQAKGGDLDSRRLLTSKEEWFKKEAQKDLNTLTLPQKEAFLKEVQAKVNKIAQKINLSYTPTNEEIDESLSNPAKLRLKAKQQTEEARIFEKSCDALIQSFEPMLNKGQKIVSIWDRENHNLIVDVADFNGAQFNLNDPMLKQVEALVSGQGLEMPQHRETIPQFKAKLALEMIDFYLSPDNMKI
ncbi:MAG: hypothetical protein WC747_01310 [Candidatus Babeliales bacterium]|jgi:hypothetical protein